MKKLMIEDAITAVASGEVPEDVAAVILGLQEADGILQRLKNAGNAVKGTVVDTGRELKKSALAIPKTYNAARKGYTNPHGEKIFEPQGRVASGLQTANITARRAVRELVHGDPVGRRISRSGNPIARELRKDMSASKRLSGGIKLAAGAAGLYGAYRGVKAIGRKVFGSKPKPATTTTTTTQYSR